MLPAPPAVPALLPEPRLDAACVHEGGAGTQAYNVNGPAGTPNRVTALADVPWEQLNPGDTVRIHWREQPYAEKLMLFRSGTAAQPVRVCGVAGGPDGQQRPALVGLEARTRTAAAFRSAAPLAQEAHGIVVVSGPAYGQRVEHVVVDGLRIGDTRSGPGRDDVTADDGHYVSAQGTRVRYSNAAACIRVRQARHVTLRNNEITNCGDGLFVQSQSFLDEHLVRHLLVEGNHLHGNGQLRGAGSSDTGESRHAAYLQGMDITVQFNVFGPMREVAGVGAAKGNQLKTRAAGLVVRHNAFVNGARMLDIVEPEDHVDLIAPWLYHRFRATYFSCQGNGCAKLNATQLATYDQRQAEDWAKLQAAYVYGNLMHVQGRYSETQNPRTVPSNLVHYGFDNNQLDRQPGVLWFFHNTVLVETDRQNMDVVRLFDYGSDNGSSYYDIDPRLTNADGRLRYRVDGNGRICNAPAAGCTDHGEMLQNRPEHFGRMRAFNNAIAFTPMAGAAEASDWEFSRRLWDQLDLVGPNWITSGWNVDRGGDGNGGGLPRRRIDDDKVWPGGNDRHHITGLNLLLTGSALPIAKASFAPLPAGPLFNAAGPWDARLNDALRPGYSVTLDAARPGRLTLTPRAALTTIGAVQ